MRKLRERLPWSVHERNTRCPAALYRQGYIPAEFSLVRERLMSTIALTEDTFEDTDDVRARLDGVAS